ncbi:MAG: amino acid adenylation domain-containing protein [Desulfofustis sp.]|nr:amino acid adenylation domain-containing protein [Desulfofustis sp.]
MAKSLVTYLSESSERYPENIALRYKSSTLTYRELDQRSNQLGFLLVDGGITCGERVGLYLDKSPEAIVAIFSILKSGGSYVPLEPLAPEQRLSMIVDDCRLRWLVTNKAKLPVAMSLAKRVNSIEKIIAVDAEKDNVLLSPSHVHIYYKEDLDNTAIFGSEKSLQVTQPDLAYILYTSGSTGRPKGVMITHGAACAFVDWARIKFQLDSSDVLSAHAPLHFDLSIFDIFGAIAAGATICLVPQGWSAFPKTIAEFIVQNKITTWYSVPTALVQLVMHGDIAHRDFSNLKRILFAGEVFPSKYLNKLMHLLPEIDYFNLYGPTETNVITCHEIKEPPSVEKDVPIGTMCDGVTGYVVSEAGILASRGEIGELYAKSPTLMNGYWNDEPKTKAVLITNPFDPDDESPIYKTGDLVHQDENGHLIYHGRIDSMIKSRGYRIELGEIETVLAAHGKIRESAVTPLPSDQFGSIITAVLVTEPDTDLDEDDVLRYCRDNLPTYMVPEIIRFRSVLPRTSTGKVDRKTLESLN